MWRHLRSNVHQRPSLRPFSSISSPEALVSKEPLIIFDTTLRDGEQSPGATLNFKEKLDIARALSLLRVDVCEAGFPIASPGDFDAVSAIACEIGPLVTNDRTTPMCIAGLARATTMDIQRCFDAVKHAPRHRIHTFLATSDIHLKYKLNMTRQDALKRAVEAVAFASSLSPDVEFSPEDAGRSDPDFLCEVLDAVIAAGATTLNIPDTVGYTVPGEYGHLMAYVMDNISDASKRRNVVFSTHCHNDLGLATANTLAGVVAGARQVEVGGCFFFISCHVFIFDISIFRENENYPYIYIYSSIHIYSTIHIYIFIDPYIYIHSTIYIYIFI